MPDYCSIKKGETLKAENNFLGFFVHQYSCIDRILIYGFRQDRSLCYLNKIKNTMYTC